MLPPPSTPREAWGATAWLVSSGDSTASGHKSRVNGSLSGSLGVCKSLAARNRRISDGLNEVLGWQRLEQFCVPRAREPQARMDSWVTLTPLAAIANIPALPRFHGPFELVPRYEPFLESRH